MKEEIFSFQDSFLKTHMISAVLENFCQLTNAEDSVIRLAGRVMAKREMGKVVFFDLQDGSGRIQCYVNKSEDEKSFDEICTIKIGDIVGVSGKLFLTRKEEKTLRLSQLVLLTSTMRGLPEKYHGLSNQEVRYRKRYLDLIMNEATRNVFQARSEIILSIRNFLSKNEFVEVETPVLQKNPCGASANPFSTRHEAYGIDLYLRISPETFLKQLIVGGMEKVFEIGKNFRNEGTDPSHLQEFTMLEYYAAYWSYRENISFIQEILKHVVLNVTGSLQVKYQDTALDFSSPWKVVEYRDLVLEDCGIDVLQHDNVDSLKADIASRGIELSELDGVSLGGLIDKLYKKVSRSKLVQPTILLHHPSVLIPLARRNESDPRVIDSFQVLVNGWEIVKAYSELADPILQRNLLEGQLELREHGDAEAMFLDDDFLTSLEHGMPPVSGLGLGIDRLVALLTNQKSLRDVVFFPTMK